MINILAEVVVADFSNFLDMFSTKGLKARQKFGCLESQVFKIEADKKRIIILFGWSSRTDFENFLGDAQVKETMKASGMLAPPTFTILEKAAEFHG